MILGIESTAHTFGIGIVNNGKILSNINRTYTTEFGGIIPTEAAKHHFENKNEIYFEALEQANAKESELDAVAFSQGPGLAPCLLEGMKFAKELARKLKIPLVPVNHCIAHLEIGKIAGAKDPVMLYVSGANTQIIAYEAGKYRIFGETLDIGVGNFIDNFARFLGIGFPGGPKIEALAKKGKKYIELPYTVKGMDVALSGILTNLKKRAEEISQPPSDSPTTNSHLLKARDIDVGDNAKNDINVGSSDNVKNFVKLNKNSFSKYSINNHQKIRANASERGYTKEDLAFSMQETTFAMLVETAERALAHTGKKELLLAGGVACNKRLQEMCRIMCKERNCKFFVPDRSLLVDNGAMIAYLGEIMFNSFSSPSSDNLHSPKTRDDDKKLIVKHFDLINKSLINKKFKLIYYLNELDKVDIKPRQRTDEVEVKWK